MGYKGDFVFNAEKPDGTLKKLTDCSKLNNLGWKHKIELVDGIEKNNLALNYLSFHFQNCLIFSPSRTFQL